MSGAGKPTDVEDRNPDAEAAWEAEDESLMQLDPTTMDPDYKYRFAYNEPNRLARLRARGYEFVMMDDEEKLRDPLVGKTSTEGYLSVGDTVLMRCPKRRYDRRRERIKQTTEGRLNEEASAQAKADIMDVEQKTGIRTKIITSPGGTTV